MLDCWASQFVLRGEGTPHPLTPWSFSPRRPRPVSSAPHYGHPKSPIAPFALLSGSLRSLGPESSSALSQLVNTEQMALPLWPSASSSVNGPLTAAVVGTE